MDDLQLQERITSLERELVSTKLPLACAKSTEDSLKHHHAKMSANKTTEKQQIHRRHHLMETVLQ
jgi:hypothetical protein